VTPPESLFLLQDGQQFGPYPFEALGKMVKSGTLTREDLVWGEGMPEWIAIGTFLPEASEVVGDAAAATPAAWNSSATPTAEPGFGWYVMDAFSYPFRGDGFIILALGMVLFTIVDFIGLFSLFISIAAWGYLLLMLQQVIHGTAMGENRLPNWPDFDGFGELFTKWVQWLVVMVVSFGAAIVLAAMAGAERDQSLLIGAVAAFLAGSVYFPMAILSVGMHDTVGGLSPILVFRSIFQVPGHYLLTLVIFGCLAGLQILTSELSKVIPIGGVLIDKLDELWSAVFLARVLGGLYYVNRRKLSWFGE